MTLLDTNVLIELLKRNPQTQAQIRTLSQPPRISVLSIMELIHGAHNKQEVANIEHFLRVFETLQLSSAISATALTLMRRYAKSHTLEMNDSLIAATALEHRIPLLTYNNKDFRFIHALEMVAP
ncbi:MAG: type II toxin-antitoxin system VapC family toxin [Gammaproteobacteria bacterium]|nr:type II toxin-antitoxin system VapC family toxin [Gammaproteobacteria bacterium]